LFVVHLIRSILAVFDTVGRLALRENTEEQEKFVEESSTVHASCVSVCGAAVSHVAVTSEAAMLQDST
jgi:hypothetical protein